jgi:disulfide bond formation protein DsbB
MGTALAAILAACRPLGWFLRILNGGLTTILLGLGIGLGAYHTAVEHHWVEPPHACLNARMDGNTIEEVKYEILHEVNVPCNVVGWRFLGLSMTEYSLMAFLFLWLSSLVSMGRLWRERNYP